MRLEVCIDVNDMEGMAAFWQLALGYQRGTGDGQPYLNLVSPDGTGPVVFLQRVPEPRSSKTRLHLDLYVADPEQHVERLAAAGARVLGERGNDAEGRWQVMADPEGNEFCVLRETLDGAAGMAGRA